MWKLLSLALALGSIRFASAATEICSTACPYDDLGSSPSPGKTDWWKPALGATWQVVLSTDADTPQLNDDYEVYDLDVFDVDASVFQDLQSKGKKVMCYFSAGSYEDWREDCGCFKASDLGSDLDGWEGEAWLKTDSQNVRNIMLARLDMAVDKGCNGVDPDNVDGFDNDNGLGLTETSAKSYLSFLSDAAHSRGLAIGLKNAGAIASDMVDIMEWEVNEECIAQDNCADYAAFVDASKPVFNIEYPPEDHIDDPWTTAELQERCKQKIDPANGAVDFSTVMKNHSSVDEWIRTCSKDGDVVGGDA